MTARHTAQQLGGSSVLDREIQSDFDLVEAVREGLSASALEMALSRGMLSQKESDRLVIPRRPLSYRKKRGERLSTEESDKLARVARTEALAEETFQNKEKARGWLCDANRALGGQRPIDLLETEGGAQLVEQMLLRIAHGVFS